MSVWLPWLAEAQPEPFLEMSVELAQERGISNGGRVIVSSARGEAEMAAIVTPRLKPFAVDGKTVHEVGMPWHFSWQGLAKGATANVLTPHVGDGLHDPGVQGLPGGRPQGGVTMAHAMLMDESRCVGCQIRQSGSRFEARGVRSGYKDRRPGRIRLACVYIGDDGPRQEE